PCPRAHVPRCPPSWLESLSREAHLEGRTCSGCTCRPARRRAGRVAAFHARAGGPPRRPPIMGVLFPGGSPWLSSLLPPPWSASSAFCSVTRRPWACASAWSAPGVPAGATWPTWPATSARATRSSSRRGCGSTSTPPACRWWTAPRSTSPARAWARASSSGTRTPRPSAAAARASPPSRPEPVPARRARFRPAIAPKSLSRHNFRLSAPACRPGTLAPPLPSRSTGGCQARKGRIHKENTMRHYEVVFLVHPDQSEQVPAMIERYKSLIEYAGGTNHRLKDWGRLQLAYPIQNLVKAHYVLFNAEVGQAAIDELVETFRFNDAILRHLVIRRDGPETEQSLIMKSKDEKGDKPERGERRRRDEEGEGTAAAETDGDNAEAAA